MSIERTSRKVRADCNSRGRLAACAMVLAMAICVNGTGAQNAASPATQGSAPAAQNTAPAPTATSLTDIAGIWQGTLTPPNAQKGTRVVIKITKGADGAYKATLFNADSGSPPLVFASASLQGAEVKLESSPVSVEGKLSADGKTIDGNWGVGHPNPISISFARTEPDAAWPIPEPIKPMAADANPGFDVVTIKPSEPGKTGKGFGFNGTRFRTIHTNMNDLIAFAYGLHSKQIVGAPDWFGTDLFDIEGEPDVPGQPSMRQSEMMIQKLLPDRFALKFHHEQRELPVYIITVAAGGPKMAKRRLARTIPRASVSAHSAI